MSGRSGGRRAHERYLVQGLTDLERIARLEGTVFGSDQKRGLDDVVDDVRRDVADLKHNEGLRQMPWYLRLWFRP